MCPVLDGPAAPPDVRPRCGARQALELRRASTASLGGKLDLAASLVKVADVRGAAGAAGAAPLLDEAAALVAATATDSGELTPSDDRKLAALQAFLNGR